MISGTEAIGGIVLAIVLIIGLVVYVTQRRLKQKGVGDSDTALAHNLRDEKQKSMIILSSIEDGVLLIDDKKTIQAFNQGASNITGWPIEEATGLDCRLVFKLVDDKDLEIPEDKNPFMRIYKESGTIRDNNAILVTRGGEHQPISLAVSPVMNESGMVTAAVATFRDVAKERQQEQQRADFISTASHEMRTPVAAIEGYLSLALNDKVSTIDTRARSYLEKAHSATKHLGELFQDLLTSAKAEDGRLTNHPSVIELGEYLEHLSEDLRFAAQKKQLFSEFVIGSTTDIDASSQPGKVMRPLYYVHADPDRLREVITNLFDNGVKYTDSGKITIGLTGNDDVCQLYIRDTGNGIAASDVPHLFQKFYRVDSSATRTVGGTGLGLFICRKIIELYKGRIWVESESGKGSTFYINLPRLTSQRASEMQAQESSEAVLQQGVIK
ncbi:MAG: ATP-binding protein [Candidatus Saccharimonadales bacterium]